MLTLSFSHHHHNVADDVQCTIVYQEIDRQYYLCFNLLLNEFIFGPGTVKLHAANLVVVVVVVVVVRGDIV